MFPQPGIGTQYNQLALIVLDSPDRQMLQPAIDAFFASLAGVISQNTEIFYLRRLPSLSQFLGDIRLATITLDQLRAWRADLARSKIRYAGTSRERPGCYSPYTLHQFVRVARKFFKWCEETGRISSSPARRLELPPLPSPKRRGISPESARLIFAACSSPRDYAILRLLYDTAARVGGVAGLCLDDLDLDCFKALVREKGRGGHGKERFIFLMPSTVAAIREYLAVRPNVPFDNLFVGKRGPIHESGIYQIIKRIAKRAGVKKGWNPHNWRHARIRMWLSKGMPLKTASELAGHSSIRITADIYGTSSDQELLEAAQKYY